VVELVKLVMDYLLNIWLEHGKQLDITSNDFFRILNIEKQPTIEVQQSYWIPVLYTFYKIGVSCELEIRSKAIHYLFEILKEHYMTIPSTIWEIIFRTIMMSLLDMATCNNEKRRRVILDHNSTFVREWLSTTYVLILRFLTDLFSIGFKSFIPYIDILLEIYKGTMVISGKSYFTLYICDESNNRRSLYILENESVAHVGNSCFQQFLIDNYQRFDAALWFKMINFFASLFKDTLPYELFEFPTRNMELSSFSSFQSQKTITPSSPTSSEEPLSQEASSSSPDFQSIIIKCVLQLLLIQNLNELLNTTTITTLSQQGIYGTMPTQHLMTLVESIKESYEFGQRFNRDLCLRHFLWDSGFMKQLPNLLKQETMAFMCYFSLLKRIYHDQHVDRISLHLSIEKRLIL
jgi:brefeldin A-inhibited guanine nucleotide-exchange protein